MQYLVVRYFEGLKIKVATCLDSIKEKPNDSDNNGSDPSNSSGNNGNSYTKSGEELKDRGLQFLNYGEEEEENYDEPVVVQEIKEEFINPST